MSLAKVYMYHLVTQDFRMLHLLQRLEVHELFEPLLVNLTTIGYLVYYTKKNLQTAKILVLAIITRIYESTGWARRPTVGRSCGE